MPETSAANPLFALKTHLACDLVVRDGHATLATVGLGATVILGWSRAELEAQPLSFLIELPTELERFIAALNSSADEARLETRVRARHGRARIFDWSLMRQEESWFALGTDVTRASEDHARVETFGRQPSGSFDIIAETAPVAILYLDSEERFVFWNRHYAEKFNRPPPKPQQTLRDYIGEEGYKRISPILKRALAGESFTYESDAPASGARSAPAIISSTFAPHRTSEGRVAGVVAIIQNITELRLAEREALHSAQKSAASAEHLRLALLSAQMGAWEWDVRSGAIAFDRISEKLFGYKEGTFAGTLDAFRERMHEADREHMWLAVRVAIAERSDYDTQYRMRHDDGSLHWVRATGAAFYDEAGEALRMVGVVQDVTAQKNSETALLKALRERGESLAALATVNRVGQQLVAELDLEKLVQAVTDAAVSVTNAAFGAFFYNVVDESGRRMMLHTLSGASKEVFASFPMPRQTAVFSPTFNGRGTVFSDDITKDARYGHNDPHKGLPKNHPPVRSYLAVSVVSRSGEVIGGLFLGHPEAARFSAESAGIVEGLASQAAIAMDNARLYQRLQDSVRVRDEFISIASHELKTPLTGLSLQSQLRRRQLQKGMLQAFTPEALTKIFESDARQLTKLNRLIDDMLDISRIRMGRLEIKREPLDLCALVQETVARFRPQVEEEGGSLIIEKCDPAMVEADAFRIEQVLTNLLTNAMKYGLQKPIHVSALAIADRVRVSVRDEGVGIEAADQDRIFRRFERAISANEVSGLGLGLAIAQDIVEAHGGRIFVESEAGRGSTFSFELKLQGAD